MEDITDFKCKRYSIYKIPISQPIYDDPDFGFDTVKQLGEERIEFDEYDEANERFKQERTDEDNFVFIVDEFEGMIL